MNSFRQTAVQQDPETEHHQGFGAAAVTAIAHMSGAGWANGSSLLCTRSPPAACQTRVTAHNYSMLLMGAGTTAAC
jgi:hypothetical protein